MGNTDGTILGFTKEVNAGPAADNWNLVIVAEGYQANQNAQFEADARQFIAHLWTKRPFSDPNCRAVVNIYFLKVGSTDNGLDEPGQPPVATYFDARHEAPYILVNEALVRAEVGLRLKQFHAILVLVSSTIAGGAGNPGTRVAVTSVAPSVYWENIALHELGHAAFDLADEYESSATATAPVEPDYVNVTVNTDPATIKWADLLAAAGVLPTDFHGDCRHQTPPDTPAQLGDLGAFEGAYYQHCNFYRPQNTCMMRDYSDYCPVCDREVRLTLVKAQVTTTTLNYGRTAPGVTRTRFINLRVTSSLNVTATLLAPLPAGFSTPVGPQAIINAGVNTTGRLQLDWTAPATPGAVAATVEVRVDPTGEIWPVEIVATVT